MTHEEFERLNPIICNPYGFIGHNQYDIIVKQGKFLAERTFILDTLDMQEAKFIRLRYGIEYIDPMIIKDIAAEMSISTGRAKELDMRTIRKLRHPFRLRLLREYTDQTITPAAMEKFNKSMENVS